MRHSPGTTWHSRLDSSASLRLSTLTQVAGRRTPRSSRSADLFSSTARPDLIHQLGQADWPPSGRFPVNQGGVRVRQTVWADLVTSDEPLVIAGYSSIGELIDLLADWATSSHGGTGIARILFGAEPFSSERVRFGDPRAVFTEEVTSYWIEERGISVLRSARILVALELLRAGRVEVRFLHA